MLGLIGKKVGMTQVFDANGRLTPVTVIKIEDNVVIANRTEEKNGYLTGPRRRMATRQLLSVQVSRRRATSRSLLLASSRARTSSLARL